MTRSTNTEFVTELMEFSPTGAMPQMFIIEAISRYADAVSSVSDEDLQAQMEGSIIDPTAWKRTAEHIKRCIEARMGGE